MRVSLHCQSAGDDTCRRYELFHPRSLYSASRYQGPGRPLLGGAVGRREKRVKTKRGDAAAGFFSREFAVSIDCDLRHFVVAEAQQIEELPSVRQVKGYEGAGLLNCWYCAITRCLTVCVSVSADAEASNAAFAASEISTWSPERHAPSAGARLRTGFTPGSRRLSESAVPRSRVERFRQDRIPRAWNGHAIFLRNHLWRPRLDSHVEWQCHRLVMAAASEA